MTKFLKKSIDKEDLEQYYELYYFKYCYKGFL